MSNINTYISKYLLFRVEEKHSSHDSIIKYKRYLAAFVCLLEKHTTDMSIENITYEIVKEYQDNLAIQKTKSGTLLGHSTQNTIMVCLVGFCRWLAHEKHLDVDPTSEIKYIKKPKQSKTSLSKNYPGGKGGVGVYQKLINLMPPHNVYIETHLGEGSIIRKKRPAESNIGIEINPKIIKKWTNENQEGINIIQEDAVSFLKNYRFTGNEMVYCDPPYVRETRKKVAQYYKFEYTIEQHIELLNVIKLLPCNVMISGYFSTLYSEELKGWHTESFSANTSSGKATEWLWMNYPPPMALHDYSYLGETYRDRERIKNKTGRWMKKIKSLSILDRQALLSVIEENFMD